MLITTSKQHGSSLVELMISLVISLIVLLGMITVTVTSLQRSRENLQIIRLNEELRASMDIITNEIRRAGYWRDADTNPGGNPFMVTGSTDISIPSASCIIFTYDKNNDGALPTVNVGTDDERYGFRLNGGAIQTRTVSSTFNCTAAASNWENLTDPNTVNVTALQFTTVPAAGFQVISMGGAAQLTVREIRVSITGSLVGNAAVSRTLVSSVRVQNDKYTP